MSDKVRQEFEKWYSDGAETSDPLALNVLRAAKPGAFIAFATGYDFGRDSLIAAITLISDRLALHGPAAASYVRQVLTAAGVPTPDSIREACGDPRPCEQDPVVAKAATGKDVWEE